MLVALVLTTAAILTPRTSGAQAAGTAVVLGTVKDSLGRAVSGAVVSVKDQQTSTNADGAFEFAGVPTGVHPLQVRRIGFVSQSRQVTLFEGDTLRAVLTLARLVTLDSIEVAASGSGIAEFEERRATGSGHYITRAQLRASRNRRVSDVLARVPGMRVQASRSRGESYATSSRSTASAPCYAAVYIDDFPVYTGPPHSPFNLNTLSVADIEGIEFYRSGGSVPAKYNRLGTASCGVLVLWTRRQDPRASAGVRARGAARCRRASRERRPCRGRTPPAGSPSAAGCDRRVGRPG